MKIGTLRNIADLSDQEFALVLQALPAIRQEILSFNNKIGKAIGVNDCDFLTYDFVVDGKGEAQNEFLRWMNRTVKEEGAKVSAHSEVEELRIDNAKLSKQKDKIAEKCNSLEHKLKKLEKENHELKSENFRLTNELAQRKFNQYFPKDYWLKDYQDFIERDNLGNYKVISDNNPWDLLVDLVNQSTKGGV